jgi:endonuclease IV
MNFKEIKGSSLTNSLKVDELRKFGINLHTNIEEQKKVLEEYEKRHIEIQQANLKYDQFMNHLSFSLLNNHK